MRILICVLSFLQINGGDDFVVNIFVVEWSLKLSRKGLNFRFIIYKF